MVVNGENQGMAITVGADQRITRLGSWMRATKIDELPQLLNVLVGEMSFVGPRPEVQKFVKLYDSNLSRVLELKPGITDLASLKYSNESELLKAFPDPEDHYVKVLMPDKIAINIEYAAKADFLSDLQVILATLHLRQPPHLDTGRTGTEASRSD